jgi:hypothetical protein
VIAAPDSPLVLDDPEDILSPFALEALDILRRYEGVRIDQAAIPASLARGCGLDNHVPDPECHPLVSAAASTQLPTER